MDATPQGGLGRWWRAVRDAVRALPHADRRARMVHAGLTAAYERAGEAEPFDLAQDRLVIFSDHHRGGRDGADDFLRCERAYRAALGHYLESGHTLALLGDVEELWECPLPRPVAGYPAVLELERMFHQQGRLWRFWGNHDMVWSTPRRVRQHLERALGGPVVVRESVRLAVHHGGEPLGELFLTHGHQGTPDSDLFAPIAMIPVRYAWPVVQRKVGFASTTPARSFDLRATHDERMFEWARAQDPPLVLITGHTHKPVFRRRLASGAVPGEAAVPTEAEARERLAAAHRDGRPADECAELHAMLEFIATGEYGPPARELDPPCYFNTGCCSFGDGDVTGIEISDGAIRLVRWLDDAQRPRPQVLSEREPLREILEEVRDHGRAMAQV